MEHLTKKTLTIVIHENQEFDQKYPFHSIMTLQEKSNNTAFVLLGSTLCAPREDYDFPIKDNLID